MKEYEGTEAQRRFMPMLPIVARLDGRNFSSFTRGLARPYDKRLSDLMRDLTVFLVQETGAVIGYTQSDEITLVILQRDPKSQVFFDGRVQKIVSTLAAMASVRFNVAIPSYIPEKEVCSPTFDCRAWSVPSLAEAANAVLWRELDATKNAISMAAHHYFSHKELQGRNGKEMQEMLFQRQGINFNDYPDFFKRGTFVQRVTRSGAYTSAELDALPPKHNARTNPGLVVERSSVEIVPMPPLLRVSNREQVLFEGAEPATLPKEDVA